MGEATVRRVDHGGREWLHVCTPAGELGWMCLSPPLLYPSSPRTEPMLRHALAGWFGAPLPDLAVWDLAIPLVASPAVASAPAQAAGTHEVPAEFDLARRAAGAAVRAKAEELRRTGARPGTLQRIVLGVPEEERSWLKGLEGERLVGQELQRLPRSWRVLHSIPVGAKGSDIDHIAIGPGGVFSLNAKHHPGASIWVHDHAFKVNGASHPYLRNSRHEAERAERILSAAVGHPVPVRPVIVPVSAARLTIKQMPPDVSVISSRQIASWLKRRPDVLSPAEVQAIFQQARDERVWQPA
jgi:hypothetical protein